MTDAPARDTDSRANLTAAVVGLGVNILLVAAKLAAGILGNSYALIADAVESSTDVFASVVVWAGLRISQRPASEDYPYGYGKAEPLTVAIVALLLLGAAFGIATAAVREIVTPHHSPAPWTLAVLLGVVVIKESLFRTVLKVSAETDSSLLAADAWHHRSDALTSAAAFIGISVALWGGPGWESADDWAALLAAGIIGANGVRFLRLATQALMDRQPEPEVLVAILQAAQAVPGVKALEKLRVRRAAERLYVDLHVQADPGLSLYEAHALGGRVKAEIRARVSRVCDVLIHMEPYGEPSGVAPTVAAHEARGREATSVRT
jgi:cation diffusion facilitator family transporter